MKPRLRLTTLGIIYIWHCDRWCDRWCVWGCIHSEMPNGIYCIWPWKPEEAALHCIRQGIG